MSKRLKKLQDVDIVTQRLVHAGLIEPLRKKYDLPKNGLPYCYRDENGKYDLDTTNLPFWDWQSRLTKKGSEEFERDIAGVMRELDIPSDFYFVVLDYIRYNSVDEVGPANVEASLQKNPLTKEREIVVIINANTKHEELKSQKLWKRIKELQKELVGYGSAGLGQHRLKEWDKLKKIYEWRHKEGLTLKQINKKLPKPERYEDYQSIGTVLTRYERYIGINKTRKKKK